MAVQFPYAAATLSFDLDGTLADTVPDLFLAAQGMLAELGEAPRRIDEIHAFVGKGIPNLVERCLTWDAAPEKQRLDQAVAVFQRHYHGVNGRHAALYAGVQEALDTLRAAGYPLACVTNKSQAFTLPLLEYLGIRAHFAVVVSGDSVARKKPHPEPLLAACASLGVAPQDNLHVGDSGNDIACARAAGCPVVCVPYGYNEGVPVDKADCDALISSLAELPGLLRPLQHAGARPAQRGSSVP
ncbi:MAG: phosphoglycolate phosphatase [Rhodocyclaceae bacterium]|nr:phosphoglycolate phosphatase [Rhodocyclaceae bacterium]